MKIQPTLSEVKYQKLAAQAQREVFMNSVLTASYVKMDDMKITWDSIMVSLKNYLMGLPAGIAPLVVGKENKDEVIRIMRDYIYEYLNNAENLEPEVIMLRNKKMMKYQEKIKENNSTRINLTRVKV